jgi:hypothetical protein
MRLLGTAPLRQSTTMRVFLARPRSPYYQYFVYASLFCFSVAEGYHYHYIRSRRLKKECAQNCSCG